MKKFGRGKKNTCNVYVIVAEGDAMKVGISDDVDRRIDQLQSSNHRFLTLHAAYRTKSQSAAFILEGRVHGALRSRGMWMRGEWFEYDPDLACSLIESLAEQYHVVAEQYRGAVVKHVRAKTRHRKLDSAMEDAELSRLISDPWELTAN